MFVYIHTYIYIHFLFASFRGCTIATTTNALWSMNPILTFALRLCDAFSTMRAVVPCNWYHTIAYEVTLYAWCYSI